MDMSFLTGGKSLSELASKILGEPIAFAGGRTPAYLAKQALAATSLVAVATAFELASTICQDVKDEVAQWGQGLSFCMGVFPNGPYMTLKKTGDKLVYLGSSCKDPDVAMYFKSLDAAVLSFTAQIGTHEAVAQHRLVVHGNLTEAMKVSRTLDLVQIYLFPGFLTAKIYKNPPKLSRKQFMDKGKLLAMIGPRLAKNALKR